MADALTLLEDDISELNNESVENIKTENQSLDISRHESPTSLSSDDESDIRPAPPPGAPPPDAEDIKDGLPERILTGILPREHQREIRDQVSQIEGITNEKSVRMNNQWILREKDRLNDIEDLRAMAAIAAERRERYVNLRRIARRAWEDVQRYWVWGKKKRWFRRKAIVLQSAIRALAAKVRMKRMRAAIVIQRMARGVLGRDRVLRIEASLVALNMALSFMTARDICQGEKACVGWRARLKQADVQEQFWYKRVKRHWRSMESISINVIEHNWKWIWISILVVKQLLRCKTSPGILSDHLQFQDNRSSWKLTRTSVLNSSGAMTRGEMLVRPGMGQQILSLWQAAPDPLLMFSDEVSYAFGEHSWIDSVFRRAYQYPMEEFTLAMIAVGIDPNFCPHGISFAMRCVEWGCFKALQALLEHGANLTTQVVRGKKHTALSLAKHWLRWCNKQSARIRKGIQKLAPGFARRKEGLIQIIEYLTVIEQQKQEDRAEEHHRNQRESPKIKRKSSVELPAGPIPLEVLVADVHKAEAKMDSEVEAANRQMQLSVAQAQENADILELAYRAKSSLSLSSSITSATFSKIQDSQDMELIKLRARLKDATAELEAEQPEWMAYMRQAKDWAHNMSHSLRHDIIRHLILQFTEFRQNITMSIPKIKEQLEDIMQQCLEIEKKHNIRYRVRMLKVERLEWKITEKERERAAQVTEIVRSARKERKVLRTNRKTAVNQPALAAAPRRRQARTWATDLKHAIRILLTQSSKGNSAAKLRHKYHSVLRDCIRLGATKEMLQIYKAMIKKKIGVNEKTFRLMVLVCKNAYPQPDVELCLDVLKQMSDNGCRPQVNFYNLVLNICAGAGEWRQAGRVFKMMALEDIQPTTATFITVAKVMRRGSGKDAAQMYEQMKLNGVPEYICYHAARQALGKIRDE